MNEWMNEWMEKEWRNEGMKEWMNAADEVMDDWTGIWADSSEITASFP